MDAPGKGITAGFKNTPEFAKKLRDFLGGKIRILEINPFLQVRLKSEVDKETEKFLKVDFPQQEEDFYNNYLNVISEIPELLEYDKEVGGIFTSCKVPNEQPK